MCNKQPRSGPRYQLMNLIRFSHGFPFGGDLHGSGSPACSSWITSSQRPPLDPVVSLYLCYLCSFGPVGDPFLTCESYIEPRGSGSRRARVKPGLSTLLTIADLLPAEKGLTDNLVCSCAGELLYVPMPGAELYVAQKPLSNHVS